MGASLRDRATRQSRSQSTLSPPKASVPSAALCLAISPELDAAATGEFLLSYLNSEERWGYSSREFKRGNFRQVDGLPPLDVRTLCCGCWANSPGEGNTVNWWRSDELGLDVFLHWDGDGTVVFQHANWTLENGDCKNDGDWEWVNGAHWSHDLPKNYYEDAASAIEGFAQDAEERLDPKGESATPIGETPRG